LLKFNKVFVSPFWEIRDTSITPAALYFLQKRNLLLICLTSQKVLNRTMEKHSNSGGKNGGGSSALSNGLHGLPAPSSAAVAAAAAAAAATNIPLISHLPTAAPAVAMPVSVLPQQMITAGTRKDCIRLRGLPYEAQVEHILEFLGDHAQSIVYQGVHMVYNAQVIIFFNT
jgi:hypothetical protein